MSFAPFLVMNIIAVVIIIVDLGLLCDANIHDKVSYHEVISGHSTIVRSRRSIRQDSGMETLTKDFHFEAFNRTFNCHLLPRTDFFSPNFKLKVYGANGVPKEKSFRKDQIFVGKCEGDENSEIRGTFKNDIFSGSLLYEGHLYGIENAKRHIPMPPGQKENMIVYRTSDLKWDQGKHKDGSRPSFCGNLHAKDEPLMSKGANVVVENLAEDKPRRTKRAITPSWNTCQVVAVADYKFYREIGESDIYDTSLYMAGVMDRVDSLYRQTEFNIGTAISGMGLEISEMRIYTAPTTGFNQDQGSWEALTLLQYFSRDLSFQSFCVAHLFTHQSFSGNVLGLAYIASPDVEGIGGVCSPMAFIGETASSVNTGWSSTRNENGQTVLLQQSDLVTAHELGHNWGAEHDPDNDRCSPSTLFGSGKYLMYPYSVGGYDSNNYLFSPCSRDYIGRVLANKGSSCFTGKSSTDAEGCGNGLINEGEQCDAGFTGRFNLDRCCDNNCRLTEGATCSPVNHECCSNCTTAPSTLMCRADNNIGCKESSFCDGVSLTCPPSADKNNVECLDKGTCLSGVCTSFCEVRGQIPCACSDLASSCQRCCRNGTEGECLPFDNNHPLPNGRPCVIGSCENAVCVSSSVSIAQRLFDYLESLTVNSVVRFFRDNLVGTVIVFTLILWIPASIIISCLDHKRRKNLNRSEEIEIRKDRELIYDEDHRKVIPSATTTLPRSGTTSPRYRTMNFTDLGGFGSDA